MHNPTTEVLDSAVAMKLAGASSKAVLEATGLSHSQFELHFWATVPVAQGGLLEVVNSVPLTGENVAWLRDGEQVSWGQISILVGSSESAARRAYKDFSGKLSQGKRIGHGGRWYLNERELYTDGLQRPGTEITEAQAKEIGRRNAAIEAATEQKLIHKEFDEVKAIAKAEGVSIPKRPTKAMIVQRIVKARAAKANPKPVKVPAPKAIEAAKEEAAE